MGRLVRTITNTASKKFDGWFKLNTDGASRGNPGDSSFGGVIRDATGNWILGFGGTLGHNYALFAELPRALLASWFSKGPGGE